MERQPVVFVEAGLFQDLLRLRVDGLRQDHQGDEGAHMLLVGMDGGQARLEGPLRQGLGPGGV